MKSCQQTFPGQDSGKNAPPQNSERMGIFLVELPGTQNNLLCGAGSGKSQDPASSVAWIPESSSGFEKAVLFFDPV